MSTIASKSPNMVLINILHATDEAKQKFDGFVLLITRSSVQTVETQKLNISISHVNRKIRSSANACAKIVQFLTGKDKIIFRAKSWSARSNDLSL